jgi:hypothetical protein
MHSLNARFYNSYSIRLCPYVRMTDKVPQLYNSKNGHPLEGSNLISILKRFRRWVTGRIIASLCWLHLTITFTDQSRIHRQIVLIWQQLIQNMRFYIGPYLNANDIFSNSTLMLVWLTSLGESNKGKSSNERLYGATGMWTNERDSICHVTKFIVSRLHA